MKSLSLLDELVEFGTLTAPVQPTLPKEWTNTTLIRWMAECTLMEQQFLNGLCSIYSYLKWMEYRLFLYYIKRISFSGLAQCNSLNPPLHFIVSMCLFVYKNVLSFTPVY